MPRGWRQPWLAGFLATGLLVGCEHTAVSPPYPPDPMFVARKPVVGNAEKARPLLAHSEPAVPPPPDTALASAPPQRLATRPASPEAVQTSGTDPTPPGSR
ncbi:MAG TPA: hypothetical protein VJ739_09375 [Gemmataceae bacterium]|nr:hypothetical protein [Gemmataceae bacterium]